ncbi:hypothetical protein [Novosphingobium sp. SG707]|uniref:hypothetical protein n=1 Tax=Novosphingobium sp. SG707 TaxID=2586996 RepID=UPI001445B7C0|nr:hypothetical protein [Novosphingobium sp. SG707]NKJ00952.1 hypothetical protein [Novosphingobium sp. SG707]
MHIKVATEVEAEVRGEVTRKGSTPRQWLMMEDGPGAFSFRLVRSHYQGGSDAFETPRHHHAFQQIRWAESGYMNFAPDQDIHEGDIAYFPRGTYYGPQKRDHGVGLTLQFGFGPEMLGGTKASEVYRASVERLRAHGTFEDGSYIDTDPDTGLERRRDPAEAVVEEVTGAPYVIPDERYAAPVLMHPRAYSYHEAAAGVSVKHLGAFYDHAGPNADLRLSMVRLDNGGAYTLGSERAELLWTISEGLMVDDRVYPALTCIYSPIGEAATMTGKDGVEMFVVEFPRLSEAA